MSALDVHKELIARKKSLAIGESCTGGAIAAALVENPDASKYLLGSIVAYANEWKERFLHVSRTTLIEKGAVSREVVIEMVKGLLSETEADFAIATSGLLGKEGSNAYIAIGERGFSIEVFHITLPNERVEGICATVEFTFNALLKRLKE
jgi:PncC family amidohydrolase